MTLPYIQAPVALEPRRIGTPATGILEVPMLGYLTVQEEDTISELTAEDESVFVQAAKIAEKIAATEEISISEAFALVEATVSRQPLEAKADGIRLKHAALIERIAQLVATTGTRRNTAAATAIIRHRLNQPSWTADQTRELPSLLRAELGEIVNHELAPHVEAVKPPSEDELKKPQPVSGSRSKRTGGKSSTT